MIIFEKQNGDITVRHINGEYDIEAETAQWEERNGKAKSVREHDGELPDRYFRNAWKADLSVDMIKARNIHMDKIRKERDKKLKDLDVETLKGRDVQAQKQKLRDLPETFDLSAAQTPEELKALWPEEL